MKRRCLSTWKAFSSLLLTLLILAACSKTELQTRTPALERGLPDETSYQVKITQYTGTQYEYELKADRIERFQDRRMLYGYGVTLTTFDKQNKINSTIKADTTIVDDARNLILANGHVTMNSPNGSLATSEIAWDRALDEITAPKNVKLTRDGSVLYGSNLHTNSKLSMASMESVSAEGIVDKKDLDW